MADKFERFTRRARQSLSMAQEEAQRMNHGYIGTEHLLLGLMREQEGIASRVLTELGLTLGQVQRAVERIVGRGERPPRPKRGNRRGYTEIFQKTFREAARPVGSHHPRTRTGLGSRLCRSRRDR